MAIPKLVAGLASLLILTACNEHKQPKQESAKSEITETVGPFGISMGMSANYLASKIPSFSRASDDFTYGSDGALLDNRLFKVYRYVLTSKTGVCEVGASTPDFESNRYGDQIRVKFQWVSDLVKENYGEPLYKIEKAKPNALYDHLTEFTKALHYDEYTMIHYWDALKQNKTFPNNIAQIFVVAQAPSTKQGTVMINYIFTNQSECHLIMKKYDRKGM